MTLWASTGEQDVGRATAAVGRCRRCDVLLVETIDQLSRLPVDDWNQLRREIEAKGLRVVSVDLPTSHQGMQAA